MYQPQINDDDEQQLQKQGTKVMQPAAAAQPVAYVVPSAPGICESLCRSSVEDCWDHSHS